MHSSRELINTKQKYQRRKKGYYYANILSYPQAHYQRTDQLCREASLQKFFLENEQKHNNDLNVLSKSSFKSIQKLY